MVVPERFPALRVLVDEHLVPSAESAGHDSAATEKAMFLFGLDRILDGIDVLIERRHREAK